MWTKCYAQNAHIAHLSKRVQSRARVGFARGEYVLVNIICGPIQYLSLTCQDTSAAAVLKCREGGVRFVLPLDRQHLANEAVCYPSTLPSNKWVTVTFLDF